MVSPVRIHGYFHKPLQVPIASKEISGGTNRRRVASAHCLCTLVLKMQSCAKTVDEDAILRQPKPFPEGTARRPAWIPFYRCLL
ncbi:hypothetical protein Ddc_08053 [Ditylenchus destructor]|nr:hypothetical protein Ddc_08053 [Ditylenchus destructor]